jgi:hypothetical protein
VSHDKREDIIVEIQTALSGLPGCKGVWRDRGMLKPSMAPAILLLDGDEMRQTNVVGRGRVEMPPAVFTLKPQIAILLPPRDTVTNLTLGGEPAPIGPDLSAWRVAIVAAVLNDPQLVALCSPHQITYDGATTDMKIGQDLGVFGPWTLYMFSFSYSVDPAQLISQPAVAAAHALLRRQWGRGA